MVAWLKLGNLNKVVEIAEDSLNLRQLASKEVHCERLVTWCTGRGIKWN